jgi:hypothetical protein
MLMHLRAMAQGTQIQRDGLARDLETRGHLES